MTMDLQQELTGIFRDVMENDDIHIERDTTAADIEEWDSITHIQLIVAIEKHFKLKFSSGEIHKWRNVGEIMDAIAAKRA